jgi:fibronectin type III domain protein
MLTLLLLGCGGGTDSGGLSLATPPSGGGSSSGESAPASPTASVSLAWNPVSDSSVYAYFVHYGKQPAGQAGSCNYTYSTFVGYPSATITGLDPNTQYYFSVSAYNGVESTCSNEVSTVTPSAA